MANFVSSSNMTTLMTAIAEKLNAVNGAYIARGSVAFANLPASPTKSMTGYVYNITDAFTTDSRFVEGAGKKYSANTNVVIVNVGTSSSADMKFDVIANFVDVDAITDRINDVVASIADEFSTATAYSIGDVVIYQDQLYKFKASHAAGAWAAADVDAVTIDELIAAATPSELSTSEVNALIALLD